MASWGPWQGGNCEIPGKEDAEDFRRLLSTMEALGFSVDEQNSIFRILSSVLHLGNVYFEKYEVPPPAPSCPLSARFGGVEEGTSASPPRVPQTDCQEIATVVSATEIRTVAELLQVSPEGLQKAITFKVTVSARGAGVGARRAGVGPQSLQAVPEPGGSKPQPWGLKALPC